MHFLEANVRTPAVRRPAKTRSVDADIDVHDNGPANRAVAVHVDTPAVFRARLMPL
jgi:hypothetical protein